VPRPRQAQGLALTRFCRTTVPFTVRKLRVTQRLSSEGTVPTPQKADCLAHHSTAELVTDVPPRGNQSNSNESRRWTPLRSRSPFRSSRLHCLSHLHLVLAHLVSSMERCVYPLQLMVANSKSSNSATLLDVKRLSFVTSTATGSAACFEGRHR
jgi:hypothetical protein